MFAILQVSILDVSTFEEFTFHLYWHKGTYYAYIYV